MRNLSKSPGVVASWIVATVFVTLGGTVSAAQAQGEMGDAGEAAPTFDEAGPMVGEAAPEIEEAPEAVEEAAPTVEVEITSHGHAAPRHQPTPVPSARADGEFPDASPRAEEEPSQFLHGFRLGYLFVMNSDSQLDSTDPDSPTFAEQYDLRSPHQFLVGYEVTWRMVGHDWLNVLLVGNILVSGLEQSRFFPVANGILGFEFDESFQFGVGVSLAPTRVKPAHMVLAAGWTPRIGNFYVPLHIFYVPDVDGQHRTGITLGVNWQ